MEKTKVVIVGYGFVGKGQHKLFSRSEQIEVSVVDTGIEGCGYGDKEDELRAADLIVVCVPTPMGDKGQVDINIVGKAVRRIVDITSGLKTPILIRSTVMVGCTDQLGYQLRCADRLNFAPEFIVERTGEDVTDRMMVGGPQAPSILNLYSRCLDAGARMMVTTAKIAEMVKYRMNAFLSVKVAFAVEMDEVAKGFGFSEVERDHILSLWKTDPRTGTSHNDVIADSEGRVGFGGKCLPKDTTALHYAAEAQGVDVPLLGGALAYRIDESE